MTMSPVYFEHAKRIASQIQKSGRKITVETLIRRLSGSHMLFRRF